MPTAKTQLTRLVCGWLVAFWSAAAWAAQSTFSTDLAAIKPADIAISIILAIIGGAAHCANKIAAPDVVIKSVPAEVIKDLLTSIVVGLLFFFGGSYMEWASFSKAIFITLGGYGGSRVLEPGVAAMINWLKRMAERAP